MYRNKIIKKIGGYPNKYIYAQDYAFYLKLIKNYKIKLSKKILANIRINHKDSETFRSRSISIRLEEIRLIIWIIRNIKTNYREKIKIFLKFCFIILKIFRACFN